MDLFELFHEKINELKYTEVIQAPNVMREIPIQKKVVSDQVESSNYNVLGHDVILEEVKSKVREFSYDVGDTVGGSKKELAALRKAYDLQPALATIERINELDPILARKILTKKTLFSWATYEYMQSLNFSADMAKAIKLIIRTLPVDSTDTNVISYFKLMHFISGQLKVVKTMEHIKLTITRLITLYNVIAKKSYYEMNIQTPSRKRSENTARLDEGHFHTIDFAEDLNTGLLLTFNKRFYSSSKVRTFFRDLKCTEWEDLIENKVVKRGQSTVWRRMLPENPERLSSNSIIETHKPEDVQALFNFKSIEFGNYVNDKDAELHLTNASAALQDLAMLLNVPNEALSEQGSLSLGFGSRGSGNALAHYERGYHIINLTKKKGGLGVLAHEWLHSFDNYLGGLLIKDSGKEFPMLSEHISLISQEEVKYALMDLFEAIKEGSAIEYLELDSAYVQNVRITAKDISRYYAVECDFEDYMQGFVEDYYLKKEQKLRSCVSPLYKETVRKKFERAFKTTLKNEAAVLSACHFKETGEMITLIPYPTQFSQLYLNSIRTDKGKIGKYWSSDVELLARTFESYVMTKLNESNWKNDYLVAGLEYVYPTGDELVKINEYMEQFIELVKPYLLNE